MLRKVIAVQPTSVSRSLVRSTKRVSHKQVAETLFPPKLLNLLVLSVCEALMSIKNTEFSVAFSETANQARSIALLKRAYPKQLSGLGFKLREGTPCLIFKPFESIFDAMVNYASDAESWQWQPDIDAEDYRVCKDRTFTFSTFPKFKKDMAPVLKELGISDGNFQHFRRQKNEPGNATFWHVDGGEQYRAAPRDKKTGLLLTITFCKHEGGTEWIQLPYLNFDGIEGFSWLPHNVKDAAYQAVGKGISAVLENSEHESLLKPLIRRTKPNALYYMLPYSVWHRAGKGPRNHINYRKPLQFLHPYSDVISKGDVSFKIFDGCHGPVYKSSWY